MTATVTVFDPLLEGEAAEAMLAIRRSFPGYGMYSNEGFDTGYAPEIPQRFCAIRAFIKASSEAEDAEPFKALAARTNYFRETYAYGDEIKAPGIEGFFHHEGLRAAAAELYGNPVIVPAIAYANILVPGQVLAMHTDVGEFRGANRKVVPQWLIVVMHHSRLFEEFRMKIATMISYFGDNEGGALRYLPDGIDGPAAHFETRHNTGLLLDTDSVFHGIERVHGTDEDAVKRLRPGMHLIPKAGDQWEVVDGTDVVATYPEEEIRFSVSWKAYCFADEAEHERWRRHDDDLSIDVILDRLEADLRERAILDGARPAPAEFATMLMDAYIRFPATNVA
jgi:hypothetical protein